MLDGKPPESGEPPASGAERLKAARGEFREGLGALKNLTQLLQSSKAGPKALASLLPDVHAACRTLQRATAVLLDAFGEKVPSESDAVGTLRRFVEPRLSELETTLERSLKQPINAKNRLTLEQVVTRIVRDLEGARELLAALDLAIWGPRVRVDLFELARETSNPDQSRKGSTLIRATLDCPRGIELVVNPRVVMELLCIGVELTARAGGPEAVPHIRIHRESGGQALVTVTSSSGTGDAIELLARRVLPPTLPCAHAIAAMNGGRLACSDDQSRYEVVWLGS
jgi:hypothetical protein